MFIIEVKLNWIILFALFNKRIGGIRLVSAAMVLNYQQISLEIDFFPFLFHLLAQVQLSKNKRIEIPNPRSESKNIEDAFSKGVELEARW